MEIYDEYTGQVYQVPPEEEMLVTQLLAQGRTTPEIVEVLQIPTPRPDGPEVVGYFPAVGGGMIPIEEIPELRDPELEDPE